MSLHLSLELGENNIIVVPLPFEFQRKKRNVVKNKVGFNAAAVTLAIILCGNLLMSGLIYLSYPLWNSGIINLTIYQVLVILTITAHLRTCLTDPGKVIRWSYTPKLVRRLKLSKDPMICPDCYTLMPHRTYHCTVCDRCILKLDHHCFFVNNCVGLYNQKFYFLLLMYGTLTALYTLMLCVVQVTACSMDGWETCLPLPVPLSVTVLLGVIVFSLVISVFVGGLFIKQMYHVLTDTTLVENHKKIAPMWEVKAPWASAKSVFGPFSLCWFLPILKPKLQHPHMDLVCHNTYP